jgi:hypothetical protein
MEIGPSLTHRLDWINLVTKKSKYWEKSNPTFGNKSLLKSAYIKTTGDASYNWGELKFLLLKFKLV